MVSLNEQLSTVTLGRFRVIAELGRGGMARVMLALTQGIAGFNKFVVLKVLREDLREDPESLEMFLREARLAARLSHPNIVQTLEVGEDEGNFFICMEYLEGQPLSRVLRATREKQLPLAARLQILCSLLDGLEYAHNFVQLDGSQLGLVHRDVSPNNIFITYDGQVKILDFGVAKVQGANITRAGTFKGKLSYAAPEQLSGTEDQRADLFAAGVVMWEMLAYRRFAVGNTDLQTLKARVERSEPSIGALVPSTPVRLVKICDRALELDVEQRFQSASEFAQEVRGYMKFHNLRFEGAKLAETMSNLFRQERTDARKLIGQRLKAIQEEPPITEKPPPADDFMKSEASLAGSSSDFRPPASPQKKKGSGRWLSIVGIAVLAAGAGALVASLNNPMESETPQVKQSALAVSADSETKPGNAAVVKVEISASPANARLLWDGRELKSNPYSGELPMDGSFHRLVVKAEGYWLEERMVLLDADRVVDVTLRPTAKQKKKPRGRK